MFNKFNLNNNTANTFSSGIKFEGQSGSRYSYTLYPWSYKWKDGAGNYAFLKCNPLDESNYSVLYFGITKDMADRQDDHEREKEALRRGATHIAFRPNSREDVRMAEEEDLIGKYKPVMNVHHK